jgi:hypothetical protein
MWVRVRPEGAAIPRMVLSSASDRSETLPFSSPSSGGREDSASAKEQPRAAKTPIAIITVFITFPNPRFVVVIVSHILMTGTRGKVGPLCRTYIDGELKNLMLAYICSTTIEIALFYKANLGRSIECNTKLIFNLVFVKALSTMLKHTLNCIQGRVFA